MISAAEQMLIGARHEAAHAIAYIYHGYSVDTIDVYETGEGLTSGGVRRIKALDYGNIGMAGAAIELEWMTAHHGEEIAIQWALDSWEGLAVDALQNEDLDARHDVLIPGGALRLAAPWAMAFVATNAQLITELGTLILESGGHVEAREFMPLVGERTQWAAEQDYLAVSQRMQPHLKRLRDIDRTISEWGALRDAG